MHSQIKLLTSLTQFGEECWSLATVYANTWINNIWLQTGSMTRSRMTFCVANGQDIAASSWYPSPSCKGSCMFAKLVVISSQHFSPKSSEIVFKAIIVSFLLMRSLVHSSWHCSQANYADSLGVGNSAATLPITKCAKLWGTLWQLVHPPMCPRCNTWGIHKFDMGKWSMNL